MRGAAAVTYLLGAGASVEAGVPAAQAMVQRIAQEVRALLDTARRRSGSDSYNTSGLQRAIERTIEEAMQDDFQPFIDAARHVWGAVIRLTHIEQVERTSYLQPLVALAKQRPVWITTLNYDLAIELAAGQAGITVDIGVENGPVEFHPQSQLTLVKLHGSIDWIDTANGIRRAGEAHPYPTLIFGAGNKLRVSGPFLDLLFAFRSRLDMTDELHVCGYSFRDEHVNHLIDNWLMRSRERRLVVFDPSLDVNTIEGRLAAGEFDYERRKARAEQLVVQPLKASEWCASLRETNPAQP